MQVRCEHPVVILNPAFNKLAMRFGCVVLRGARHFLISRLYQDLNEFRRLFYPKKVDMQPLEVESSYFLDLKTGNTEPLYFVVPCGHCVICRNRKANSFAARCVAELSTSSGIPLFCTFTYSPDYYPTCGLNKLDMQLFFKRLRQRLFYYGYDVNLRYTYVGEYGSNTHRAHYHAIIFNFPANLGTFPEIQKFVQRCWSRYTLDSFGRRIRVIGRNGDPLKYRSGHYVYETHPIGWVKVLPVTQGCVGYVAKYMRKEQHVPAGLNPMFSCSSNRNGGIGSDYIRQFRDSFHENPDMVSIPVRDRISGKMFYIPIDNYVKSLFMPSPSRLYTRKDYETIRDYLVSLRLFRTACVRARELFGLDRFDFFEKKVVHWKEPFFDWFSRPNWRDAYKRISSCDNDALYKEVPNEMTFLTTKEMVEEYICSMIDHLDYLTSKILEIPSFNSYIRERKEFQKRRQAIFALLFAESVYNIPREVEIITKRLTASIQRETF